MRYKSQIQTGIGAIRNTLDLMMKQLEAGNLDPRHAVDMIRTMQRNSEKIGNLLDLERQDFGFQGD